MQRSLTVCLVKRSERKLRYDLPRANEDGYRRVFCQGVAGTGCMANLIILPFGQGCPAHDFTAEVIVFGVEGNVEFLVAGERVVVEPHDFLFLPAGITYSYRNIGQGQASFVSMAGKVDEWPGSSHYEGVSNVVVPH